jgi:hypothetical protein
VQEKPVPARLVRLLRKIDGSKDGDFLFIYIIFLYFLPSPLRVYIINIEMIYESVARK